MNEAEITIGILSQLYAKALHEKAQLAAQLDQAQKQLAEVHATKSTPRAKRSA